MKFYETHFEDYLHSLQKYNLHPELQPYLERFPDTINKFANLIITGPSGVGKYTQALSIIRNYSASKLKYQKKITLQHEKYTYQYHISDIHYEVDMSLLGCNSKLIWHDIVQQIVDIVSVKPDKYGIILCKNFHLIHTELLDIFYSYIQEYNHAYSDIQLKYIILTEHMSFLPNNILNSCEILRVRRPDKQQYMDMMVAVSMDKNPVGRHRSYENEQFANTNILSIAYEDRFSNEIANYKHRRFQLENIENILANLDDENPGILNLKELNGYSRISVGNEDRMPTDNFNIICDTIIEQLLAPDKMTYTGFRDAIYDMFIYNLDIIECVCYILFQLILNGHLRREKSISSITQKLYEFLKYFNNNYRPIYHLEYIMYTIQKEIFTDG